MKVRKCLVLWKRVSSLRVSKGAIVSTQALLRGFSFFFQEIDSVLVEGLAHLIIDGQKRNLLRSVQEGQ